MDSLVDWPVALDFSATKQVPSDYVSYSLQTPAPGFNYFLFMLGEELRKARLAAGLTQEELSFRANTHRVYISELERNKKSPTVEALFRICEALGISPSLILARVERQGRPKK